MKHTEEVRQEAIARAAGSSAAEVGRQLGIPERTVEYWVSHTDPAIIRAIAEEKRARATLKVLEHTEEVVEGIMRDLKTVGMDDKGAKALQARATTLAILDDHWGGRQQGAAGSGRFGEADSGSDPRLRDIGQRILRRLGGDEPPEAAAGEG